MTTATSSSSSTSVYQCHWCERISKKKLRKCGTCFSARYCDQRCQIVHWPEHKKVCHSPHTSTTDVTKSVVNKTRLGHAQAEHTTDTFNHLNNTLTAPPPPTAEPKKEPSLSTSCDPWAQTQKPAALLLRDQALLENEYKYLNCALVFLATGMDAAACHFILQKTAQPQVRIIFLKEFTKHMCSLDRENITLVMEKIPDIFPINGQEIVIDTLIEAKIFASPEEIEQALKHSSSVPNKNNDDSSS